MLGNDAKSRFGVLEVTFATTLGPSALIPLTLLAFPEYRQWGEIFSTTRLHGSVICLLYAAIMVCKYVDRTYKYLLVHRATTMFYAFVDANMKVVAGVGSFLFFHDTDSVYWSEVLGFLLVVLSFLLSLVDRKRREQEADLQRDNKFQLLMDDSFSGLEGGDQGPVPTVEDTYTGTCTEANPLHDSTFELDYIN